MTTIPETPSEPEFDFFISYTGADLAWAKWIDWQLMEAGYKTIAQYKDFQSGGDFIHDMQDASKKCKRVLSVYSPQYMQSEFCEAEWRPRFAQDPTGKDGLLLTVRIAKVEAQQAGLLASHTYIDLVGLSKEEAKQRLLERSQKIGPPTEEPPFPGEAPAKPKQTIPEPVRFPGDMPSLWVMPHRRNPNFSGRAELLEALHKSLTSGHATALTAIHGMGGVGKTQTATEYAYRYSNEYNAVLWVAAENRETLASDYANLATELGLPKDVPPNQAADIRGVKRWLNAHDKWLLILDNAIDVESVSEYLPNGNRGHVVITSRNPQWDDVATLMPVSVWTSDESRAFILKQTGEADETVAGKLADALSNLPLALAQATSYIKQTRIAVAKYLELFEADKQEMLNSGKAFLGYEAIVSNVWNRSFEQVKESSSVASSLLNLCAFMAPDAIPRDLLAQWGEIPNEKILNDSIAALLNYSLIEATPETISVHRLVQTVTYNKLTIDEKNFYVGQAVTLVNIAFPFESDDVRNWSNCVRLLPHALASTGYAELWNVASEKTVRLLNHVGLYLRGIGNFSESKLTFERTIKIEEMTFGLNHPQVAASVNNLGNVLQDLGDLQGAKKAYERALAIDENIYGKDHPQVATEVSNLGLALRNLGDLQGAKKAFERALLISQKHLGNDSPKVATIVNNLGNILFDLGDLHSAKQAFEKALAIDEKAYGKDHPEVATIVNNLGNILFDLGDLQDAQKAFERTIKIQEATFGLDHPQVAISVNNLGNVLQDLGDLQGAKKAFERTIKIQEAIFGLDHPQVAPGINNLGNVLRALGDLQGAKKAYERALAIDENVYGKDHFKIAIEMHNLGGIFQSLGDLQGAKKAYERALAIDENVYGKDHLEVAMDINSLATVLIAMRDLQGSKQAYERAFLIFQKFLGDEHANTKTAHNNLNYVLSELGEPPVK